MPIWTYSFTVFCDNIYLLFLKISTSEFFFWPHYPNSYTLLKSFIPRLLQSISNIWNARHLQWRKKCYEVLLKTLVTFFTHFTPIFRFYTPWKSKKTWGFLLFSRGIEREYWHEMDRGITKLHEKDFQSTCEYLKVLFPQLFYYLN